MWLECKYELLLTVGFSSKPPFKTPTCPMRFVNFSTTNRRFTERINKSHRTGSAAAIAAAFNTPMAGVIFAMEVILLEYTIVGFIPVIIASVLGATISQMVFGAESLIQVPAVELNLLWEMPFMVFAGLLFAVSAVFFIRLHLYFQRWRETSVLARFAFIGLLTGSVAVFIPQIMGSGYDTLNEVIAGDVTVRLLLAIVIAKLLVTATVTGLGMLGGLIGPLLVIGGCLGGILGVIGNELVAEASSPEFYVILGMVAMMGAVLNAPMAAMVTILELSNNSGIIFPSMLMVVVACVAVQQLFHNQGIFAEQLSFLGHKSYEEPARQFLSRIGVRSVMNTSLNIAPSFISYSQANDIVTGDSVWIVIENADGTSQLISTADLAKHMEAVVLDGREHSKQENDSAIGNAGINLSDIAARFFNLARLDSTANLFEASQLIKKEGVEALCVVRSYGSGQDIEGILTRDAIQKFYGI